MSFSKMSFTGFSVFLLFAGFSAQALASGTDQLSVNAPCSKQVTSVVRALMMVNGENYRLLNLNFLGTVEGTRSQPQYVLRAMAADSKTNDNNIYEAYADVDSCRVVRVEHIED